MTDVRDDTATQHYEYSRIEFIHPDPNLDLPGTVTIEVVVDGEPLVAGADVEVV